MAPSPQIIVVGSHTPGIFLRVKRVPRAGETVIGWDYQEPMDGGKGSNQAIAAARLGARVSFVGCVGRDRIGDTGERWMREAGVDTRWLLRSEKTASGVGFIMLDENGVPAMVTSLGASAELSESDVDRSLAAMKGASVLLTQFEIKPAVAIYAARTARLLGMTTIINPAPAVEFMDGLKWASILIPNETEAKILLGMDPSAKIDPVILARQLREHSQAETVVVTLGEKGIAGADAAGEWLAAPPPVRAVDTSGAGDVFCAALAVGLVQGETVRQASRKACAIAALSVTKPGTIPSFPSREEAEAFLHGHPEVRI